MKKSVLLIAALAALITRTAAAQPAVCTYGPGALPAETLPPGTPHGDAIPINHIVLLMQENRSYDHYMGMLHRSGQPKSEPLPPKAKNVDPTGATDGIKPFHQKMLCEVADLDHSWTGTHV